MDRCDISERPLSWITLNHSGLSIIHPDNCIQHPPRARITKEDVLLTPVTIAKYDSINVKLKRVCLLSSIYFLIRLTVAVVLTLFGWKAMLT